MKNKKTPMILVLSLFLCLLWTYPLHANLFLDESRIPFAGKVNSFDMNAFGDTIGVLVSDQADQLFYFSSPDAGMTFTRPVRLSNKKLLDYTLTMDKSGPHVIWFEEKSRQVQLAFFPSGSSSFRIKTIYTFSSFGAFSPVVVYSEDKGFLVFAENENDRSRIRLIMFSPEGDILENKVLYETGQNFLPQLCLNKESLLLVWDNITGDDEDLFYTFSRDRGKTWEKPQNLTANTYQDRGPVLYSYNDRFYLLWQDNRLGNWNIAFAEFFRDKWVQFTSLTSRLINCWIPQMGFYHNKVFTFWLDRSEGAPRISWMEKDTYRSTWSDPLMLRPEISSIDLFKVRSSGNFVLLGYLKEKALYLTKLYNDFKPLNMNKKEQQNTGSLFTWNPVKKDIVDYALYFSREKKQKFFYPVLSQDEKSFTLYARNTSPAKKEGENPVMNIRCINDIGLLSGPESLDLMLDLTGPKNVDWRKVNKEKISYNIMEGGLYLKLRYRKGVTRETIFGKLYFQLIDYFEKQDESNKFIQVFNTLNGNMDFNRLIEGDEIYLPNVWGNTYFLAVVEKDVESTLLKLEESYGLKQVGYLYYIVSGDLTRIKPYQEARQGDFLVVLRGF